MTVQDIADELHGTVATEGDRTHPVTSGYACDLLSEVIAKARPGAAWVTIQTHINVIAVAAMVGIPIVIICEGRSCEPDVLERAVKERITVLYSDGSAFSAAGKLYTLGLR